jgi:polyhydroxyalkanoate synthesis regulator phasin
VTSIDGSSIDREVLDEIVVEDMVSNAVQTIVDNSVEDGSISPEEGRSIIYPFRDTGDTEVEIERRQVPEERVRYIEDLLVELQKPRREIRNIRQIETKVFECLGLVN